MLSRSIRLPIKLASYVALGLGFSETGPAEAQAPTSAGGEFQVNVYTPDGQQFPSVAADASGGFVVVWQSLSPASDTSLSSIQGRRYASDGSSQGAQFEINTYTTSGQTWPRVAADTDGDFVVVWSSLGSSETDTDQRSIQGQRFASDGSAQGVQFEVNSYTTGTQSYPSVAAEPDGDFVVVWQGRSAADSTGIQGQLYASDGSTRGAEFQINNYTALGQQSPSVSAASDGSFVVVWQSQGGSGPDELSLSIQGRRFASDGSAQGPQFQVNNYGSNNQTSPSVAGETDGDFVVVWQSDGSFGGDTSGKSIQGRRYASDGSSRGAEFQINDYTTGDQTAPSVTADGDGDFVVIWTSAGSSGSDVLNESIQGKRFTSDGSPQSLQFQVNTYTTSVQDDAAVSAESNGDFVVVWNSFGSSGTDSDNFSIQGQRYSVATPAPPVPATSTATRFALVATMLLLGARYAFALRRRG